MQLTIPETIQILRRRKGLNQAELGVQAFGLATDSARTKIKNIELGNQRLNASDIHKLADALDAEPGDLGAATLEPVSAESSSQNACSLSAETLKLFPGLAEYFEMLNNAVRIDDKDLIGYIAGRISDTFAASFKSKAASQN